MCEATLCVDSYQLQTSHGLHINLQSTQLKGSVLLVCLFKVWGENEIVELFISKLFFGWEENEVF